MVSMLPFYSDDPISIPADVYNFFCKMVVEKNENKQKEAGVGPFKKKELESGTVAVTQMAEQTLPLPADPGLNPDISNIYTTFIKMGQLYPLFGLFSFFSNTNFTKKL